MKKLAQLLSILFVTGAGIAHCQDVHFSQMEYAPMNLNPALTGANSPMQGIVNYRSQWNSVASPYSTIAASFDARFNESKPFKKGIIAGGLSFFNDQSGDNRISATNVNLNLAYHLLIDDNNMVGIGLYGGYGQRSITMGAGKWTSQFDGTSYDAGASSGEVFTNSNFNYLDAGTGIVYTYKVNQGYMTQNIDRSFNAGVAFYHVNSPYYSFVESENERLYMRWSIFGNGTVELGNSHGAIEPGFYFNRQKNAQEILYGMYYRYTIVDGSKFTGRNKPFHMHLGLFHRWNDAMVVKSMLEWYTVALGFAYDINLSELSTASNARGGFELFLRYNMEPGGVSRAKIR